MKGPQASDLRHELTDIRHVLHSLGLLDGARRGARGYTIRCPWHNEKTPSCSVRLGPDGTMAIHCFACGAGGDVLSLIAQAKGLDKRSQFSEVMSQAATIAGMPRTEQDDRPARPDPVREYPPIKEVVHLGWEQIISPEDDPETVAMLEHRHFDVHAISVRGLAGVIPKGTPLPRWARYRGRPWTETGHRLILPMYDYHGAMLSVRAWDVTGQGGPKRLPPSGHRASGLCMLDARAIMHFDLFYRSIEDDEGAECPPCRDWIIVEGEPDFLDVASRQPLNQGPPKRGIIGIVAGSWADAWAARIPDGSVVEILTDRDAAGDRYARNIAQSLGLRCKISRKARTHA